MEPRKVIVAGAWEGFVPEAVVMQTRLGCRPRDQGVGGAWTDASMGVALELGTGRGAR